MVDGVLEYRIWSLISEIQFSIFKQVKNTRTIQNNILDTNMANSRRRMSSSQKFVQRSQCGIWGELNSVKYVSWFCLLWNSTNNIFCWSQKLSRLVGVLVVATCQTLLSQLCPFYGVCTYVEVVLDNTSVGSRLEKLDYSK